MMITFKKQYCDNINLSKCLDNLLLVHASRCVHWDLMVWLQLYFGEKEPMKGLAPELLLKADRNKLLKAQSFHSPSEQEDLICPSNNVAVVNKNL